MTETLKLYDIACHPVCQYVIARQRAALVALTQAIESFGGLCLRDRKFS